MSILNKEELQKQIREGKGMLKEAYQTAIQIELTDYLGYDKHNKSDNPNYRNGHNKKH